MPTLEELQGGQLEEVQPSDTQSASRGLGDISSVFSNVLRSLPRRTQDSTQVPTVEYKQEPTKDFGAIDQVISSMGSITTPFMGSTRSEAQHPGIDIASRIGTAIRSFSPGVVTDVKTGHKQGDPSYGNYVVVKDPFGVQHRYSHLSQSYVKIGDVIRGGQNIAAMGNTGNTYSLSGGSGSHLDYRIRDAAGKYLNPYSYLTRFYNQ